ncbi:MAG: 50S ribosomal protein L9 [Ignavibacteria bacterium]|nr:50S ribosomal protein L9 [Ignavibacteria bacterium]
MKVILKKDHELLGDEGQIVDVKNGYARNFLIPNGVAVQATESNLKIYDEIRKQRRRKIEKQMEESRSVADKITSANIRIAVKSGEEGRIFGSVTSQMIHDAMLAAGLEAVDRKKIVIKEAIKTLGEHIIDIKLQHSVIAPLKVFVVSIDELEKAPEVVTEDAVQEESKVQE